jgi:hypothetical protein
MESLSFRALRDCAFANAVEASVRDLREARPVVPCELVLSSPE